MATVDTIAECTAQLWMLYSPAWKITTFAAWLAQQDQEATYLYTPASCCPITNCFGPVNHHIEPWRTLNQEITKPEPRTYGAALRRAAALTTGQVRQIQQANLHRSEMQ